MQINIVQAFIIIALEHLESSGMQQQNEINLFSYTESYTRLNDKDSKYLKGDFYDF